jgi:hypothetical protein
LNVDGLIDVRRLPTSNVMEVSEVVP